MIKKIGFGSYGAAYLVASKRQPQQQYVLKKIPLATDAEQPQQQTEVAMLAALQHPFVLGWACCSCDDKQHQQRMHIQQNTAGVLAGARPSCGPAEPSCCVLVSADVLQLR